MAKFTKRMMDRLERTYRDKMRWLTSPGRENHYAFIRKEGEGGKYAGYTLKPVKEGLISFQDLVSDTSEELGTDEAAKKLAKLDSDGYNFVVR